MQYEKYSIPSIKSSQICFPGCGGIFMSVHGPSYYNTSRIVHFKLDYLCVHNTFVLCVFVFVLYICICVFEWNIYECSLSILRRWQNSAFWIGFKRSVVLPKVNDKQLKRNTFLKWMKFILDLSAFTNILFVYLFWWTCIFHYNVLRVHLVPFHQVSTVRTIFYLYVINGFIDLNWVNQCIICIAYMLHVKWELEGL